MNVEPLHLVFLSSGTFTDNAMAAELKACCVCAYRVLRNFASILDEGGLPVFAEIQARFMPKAVSAPTVWIEMPSASAYDPLLSDRRWEMTP